MTPRQHLAEAIRPVVDLVYPPRCPVCGEAIAEQKGVCPACWEGLVIPGSPACVTCQRPLRNTGGNAAEQQCAPCMAEPPIHDGIAAGTLYTDTSRKLVLAFKHGKRIALAPILARLMAARLPEREGDWLCVPVPLHRSRLWMRGFNQAALLAQEVGRLSGTKALVDGLLRRKRTPALGGLGRKARERTLSGAIEVNPRHIAQIKGARIILVDDVLTSGATTTACVKALKKAGAQQVIICCFSRVLDEAVG